MLKSSLRYPAYALSAALLLTACGKDDDNNNGGAPAASQSTATVPNTANEGVMMQSFYWDVPQNNSGKTWWQLLDSQVEDLHTAGITAIWLPAAYKGGAGINDMGYGVYDRYDLGEFNQKGTVATRFGTLGQLESYITNLHSKGMKAYEDVVMNHMMGGDSQESFTENGTSYNLYTRFTFPGRGNTYSSFKWDHNAFNAQQGSGGAFTQWHPWDFTTYLGNEAYDGLLGNEIRYADTTQRNETVRWGKWLTAKLKLDGYRLDATKHMYTPFMNQWLDEVKGTGRFAVCEAWLGDLEQLKTYSASLGGRSHMFDVPLHYAFQRMGNGGGSFDMSSLRTAGYTNFDGAKSVSFVDNHDTYGQPNGALNSPVLSLKMLAYSFILTRGAGYPCVFYKDYYGDNLAVPINKLLAIRKAHAYGDGLEYAKLNDNDVYVYARTGDATHTGLLQLLNDGLADAKRGVTTPFKNATLTDATGNQTGTVTTDANGFGTFPVASRNYAVWVPN